MTSTTEIDVETRERWIPTEKCVCDGKEPATWGLVKSESGWFKKVRDQKWEARVRRAKPNTIIRVKHHLVGYVHGMMQAIYMCEADGREKLIPFEIAVGELTKKLASCFQCTLYMYAAGYPPSAIHLDSGLSWVPHEHDPEGLSEQKPQKGQGKTIDDAIKDTNAKWHKFCKKILGVGMEVLDGKKGSVSQDVPEKDRWHTTRLSALKSYLEKLAEDKAGYLILDAVTIHDKESSRIDRTIAD